MARLLALLALLLGLGGIGLQLALPAPPRAPRPGPFPLAARNESRMRAAFRSAWSAGAGPELPAGAAAAFHEAPPAAPGEVYRAGALAPPLDLRAEAREGGIGLRWAPDPANPPGVAYRITRWAGEAVAEDLGRTSVCEYLDPVSCEGITYHYRVRTIPDATPAAAERAFRESAPASARLELPVRSRWSATGFDAEGRLLLRLEGPGRPHEDPWPAVAGLEIGATGWHLESLGVQETRVRVQTTLPRFDALGRRVIIGARPASRLREADEQRLLAILRLTDPCGTAWNLELLLPQGTARPGQ